MDSALKIQELDRKISVNSPLYRFEWDGNTDLFSIYDSRGRLVGNGRHQPLILTTLHRNGRLQPVEGIEAGQESVSIIYRGDDTQLTVRWHFRDEFILLEPLRYQSSARQDVLQVVYFPEAREGGYRPSFYSRYAVVPGLSMSPTIGPVVDLHSRLSTTAVLGAGAMRGPGLTQQCGLPCHYFCTFNTAERWNAIGAKHLQSGAACWGLAELPEGDFRLEIREVGLSPVLNLRSDLWGQSRSPGSLELGLKLMITFGTNNFTTQSEATIKSCSAKS